MVFGTAGYDDRNATGIWTLSGIGLIVGASLFTASLTPTLMPRDPFMQGALSGVLTAIGYGLAVFLVWVWRVMTETSGKRSGWQVSNLVFMGIAAVIIVYGLFNAAGWQNSTREVLNLDPVMTAHPIIVFVVAIIIAAILWVAGTLVAIFARFLINLIDRFVPRRVSIVAGVVLAIIMTVNLVNGVLVTRVLELADASFAAGETIFDDGKEKPTDPMMSGSDASLIAWEDLGNRGRDFVARTPEPSEIEQFSGQPAMKPVRVYVGRVSADTARQRAELALEELIRVGGFDRRVLILTTPVGTGWMDPGAHDTIDFIFNGDTAHVGAQYSYLTSILSIITHVEYGIDQARELFDVVYGYWRELPEDERPILYIHGLSQGSLNSQAAFPLLDVLDDPPAGAMWAGSPFISPMWSRIREDRNEGSPAWRPAYGNGSLVRVMNQDGQFYGIEEDWGPIRFVFLNYPSDAIVNMEIASLWRPPVWLEEPLAPDVSPDIQWFPIVTGLQTALDMTIALSYPGYGHFYVAEDYIDAWVALTDPPGWTDERSDALRTFFEGRPPPW